MNKPTSIILIALLLIGSVFAFPSDTTLGDAKHDPNNGLFSTAGQTRACSEYADASGTFTGTKNVVATRNPALINVYECVNNAAKCDQGWKYIGEYTAPRTLSYPNKNMAYEIYHCPEDPKVCSAGEILPVTETSYKTCGTNGQWGSTTQCTSGSYYDNNKKSCTSFACREQWSCTAFGACTQAGFQYRSCTDSNACGTFNDKPKTAQSCTPVYSDTTVGQNPTDWKKNPALVFLGAPTVDNNNYERPSGDTIIITQRFQVNNPGKYWIEAGIESVRTFSIADVKQNTCDPEETWYANQQVSFDTVGETSRTFSVKAPHDGEYVLHTAIVTACAGDVLEQQNRADRITVGTPPTSNTMTYGALIFGIFAILAMIGIALLGTWAFKK